MKINAVSTIVTLIFFLNIILGTGNYFNEEISENLYANLTNLTFGGNISGYDYDEGEMEDISEQLSQNPTILAVGSTFETFHNVFFGLPTFIYEVMGATKFPNELNLMVLLGLDAMMGVVYIIFILQIISYLRGGSE